MLRLTVVHLVLSSLAARLFFIHPFRYPLIAYIGECGGTAPVRTDAGLLCGWESDDDDDDDELYLKLRVRKPLHNLHEAMVGLI
jgi:hypothetical protein